MLPVYYPTVFDGISASVRKFPTGVLQCSNAVLAEHGKELVSDDNRRSHERILHSVQNSAAGLMFV